jgi:sugar lactone lactonase YvrE
MRRFSVGALACFAVLTGLLAMAQAAPAAAPKFLLPMGSYGEEADEMVAPRGIAIHPTTSHAYVADLANSRIDEYTPWGDFVKSFGWDVAPGAVDEEQEVRIRATAGQFKLSYEAATTTDLPFNATAEEVEAALNALSSISTGGGSVTVEGGPGGIPGTTPSVYVVRFDDGPLAASDLDQLAIANGTTPLSGGNPTTLETRTRADGTSAATTGLEACTAASGCKAGSSGGGAGQTFPTGMAFDAAGNLYVFERPNLRIQKFDSAGRFLWMVGGGVNQTTGEEICTQADLEASEVCKAGASGTGPREFSIAPGYGTSLDYLELGTDGNLYVGDKNRIQVIGTDGSFVREIKFADVNADDPAFPATGEPGGLAVDPTTGDLYFAFSQGSSLASKVDGVFKLSATGDFLGKLEVEAPEAVATDSAGNVYAVEVPENQPPRVIAFDAAGAPLFTYEEGIEGDAGAGLPALATNTTENLFVSETNPSQQVDHVAVYGPPPVDLAPPPKVPPEILDVYPTSVGIDSASVGALINPHLWVDTRFYVEYGTEPCETSTCTQVPVPPGQLLTDEVVDAPIPSEPVLLEGLTPETTYFFRVVAVSGGGGPVVSPEGSFATRRVPPPVEPCPGNEMPRSLLSQKLPDCRAYEMVSPIDKNGGDLLPLCEILCYPAALEQSAGSGAKLTYSTFNSFGDAESAPYSSQYLASRDAGKEWRSDGITPALNGTSELDRMYRAFTSELEYGWMLQLRPPALESGSEAPNLYRRDNANGSYKALVPGSLPGSLEGNSPELQGITPEGSCAVFRIKDDLTGNAVPDLTQTYRSCEGAVTLVSVLPGGAASTKASSAGTPFGVASNGREGSMFNALSEDGSRVFWSEAGDGAGPLYAWIEGVGSKAISSGTGLFWGAAADGSRAIYQEGANLKEATIDGAGNVATATIAAQTIGVAGMSEDATSIYFASRADLDGGGGASAGDPNLYLLSREASAAAGGGTISFVVELSELDVEPGRVSPVSPRPSYRQARVSPDGSHLAFMSRGQLTGYNNTDQKNGEPDAEVFRYEAGDDLVCVSCNPTGARPRGEKTRFGLKGSNGTGVQAAAKLPNLNSQLYFSRALSDDGSHLFFESFDQLDPDDVNDAVDIYQWEEEGAGPAGDKCEPTDASFDPASGGCIDLISSGQSTLDSEFLDASASGADVFFSTDSSLIAADPGQIDIYDARIGGGLPEPPAPETKTPQCPSSNCPNAVSPPPGPPAPQSQNQGPGNDTYKPPKPPKHCRKGTHKVKKKGKVRCVKNKKGGKANKSRRAGR